jgi:hypothetical protein
MCVCLCVCFVGEHNTHVKCIRCHILFVYNPLVGYPQGRYRIPLEPSLPPLTPRAKYRSVKARRMATRE